MDEEWWPSILLVAAAATHIGEEAITGFTRFLNTNWFAGNETCPVGRFKSVAIDKVGLFLLLATFSVLSAAMDGWNFLIFFPVGILAADVVQHAAFSVRKAAYTPGVATCALYLAFLIYFFVPTSRVPLDARAWALMLAGALFIAGNYMLASRKVSRGDCN